MFGFLKDFLQKIRNQPEKTRKFILWTIVVSVGLVLFCFWVRNFQEKIRNFDVKSLPGSEIELPKIELPKIDEQRQ